MNDELKERLEKAVAKLEQQGNEYARFNGRLNALEHDHERILTQLCHLLGQQGAIRIALKNIKASLEVAAARMSQGMSALAVGFKTVEDDLQGTLGFTQKEVEAMGSKEYREKILIPLGMGRSWQR